MQLSARCLPMTWMPACAGMTSSVLCVSGIVRVGMIRKAKFGRFAPI
jgi:hypothetical protein